VVGGIISTRRSDLSSRETVQAGEHDHEKEAALHPLAGSSAIMPRTTLGKWPIGLIVAMPLLFFVGGSLTNVLYRSAPAGNTIFEGIASRPALALTILAGTISGILAFITGLIAIISQKEHARSVYIATIVGGLLLIFLVGELVFPH
jgi:hypothetical protein